jgi:hypothetical protein
MHIGFTPPNFENPVRGIRGNFIHVSEGQGRFKNMSTQLTPISYASSIVGFVSFSLTVFICKYQQTSYFGTLGHQHILFIQISSFATIRNLSRFLDLLLQNDIEILNANTTSLPGVHAFWNGLLTLISAPHEIPDAFSTLRQGLYEEREYLKRVRRRREGSLKSASTSHKSLYYEGGPTKVMSNALKDLIHDFKSYEHPFLVTPHEGREKELEWSFDATQQAYRCDLWHRMMWLRSKGGVNSIADKLLRIQTRRIAVEVTEAHFMLGDAMGLVRECERRLGAIEERLQMSRIG